MSLLRRLLAHASPAMLFGLLFALPVTGILAMYVSARVVPLHGVLADVGLALVSLHVAAAFWHQWVRRDRLLRRMLPGG